MTRSRSIGRTRAAPEIFDPLGRTRADTAQVDALRASPEARFLILLAGKPVIVSSSDRSDASIRWFEPGDLARHGLDASDAFFLGVRRGAGAAGHFALAIDESRVAGLAHDADTLRPAVDLRSLAAQGVMSGNELSLLAQAKSLAQWQRSARYCGACGAPTADADGGWKRVCTACSTEIFPRVDPVVVMLITDGDRCVLAREAGFPDRVYSALAGFVEPGEDMEEAVRRETLEEVGLEVALVTFHTSQAWPFPHSLMLGCIAVADTQRLTVDGQELEAARWFDRAEVRLMATGTHPEGLTIPGREAIANALIRQWLDSA
jgi:NAD+ diphosphatase